MCFEHRVKHSMAVPGLMDSDTASAHAYFKKHF